MLARATIQEDKKKSSGLLIDRNFIVALLEPHAQRGFQRCSLREQSLTPLQQMAAP